MRVTHPVENNPIGIYMTDDPWTNCQTPVSFSLLVPPFAFLRIIKTDVAFTVQVDSSPLKLMTLSFLLAMLTVSGYPWVALRAVPSSP